VHDVRIRGLRRVCRQDVRRVRSGAYIRPIAGSLGSQREERRGHMRGNTRRCCGSR
jgi:hypothetical protein